MLKNFNQTRIENNTNRNNHYVIIETPVHRQPAHRSAEHGLD